MKKFTLFLALCLATLSLKSQDSKIDQLHFEMFSESDFITAPAVSFNGHYLAFVVIKDASYKIFECEISNGVYSKPVELSELTSFFGEKVYKNAPVYNYDASKLYFSAKSGNSKDIFVSNRMPDNKWSKPEALPKEINTNKDEDEPSISSNDNHLYFIRFENPKEPECGTMYVSDRDFNHQWQKAVSIIKPLNSGCERTPRILVDNKTLLFSSKREKSKDFKIYFAKNPYENVWFLPKMTNSYSKHNDLFPSADYEGEKMYFAVNHKNKKSQIYSTTMSPSVAPGEMTILNGNVVDDNNKGVNATINLLNTYSLVSHGLYNTNNDGSYEIFMKPKSHYLIDYSGKNLSHEFKDYYNTDTSFAINTINAQLFNSVNLLLKIYDKDIYEPINAKIEVVDKQNNKISCPTEKKAAGRYLIKIPIGSLYSINITNEYIKPYSISFDLSGAVIYKQYVKNVEIESKKVAYAFNIVDEETKSGINCQITMTNLNSKQKVVTTATTDKKGNATVSARKGDNYSVSVNPKGYTFFTTTINVTDDSPQTIKVKLKALKQDVKIELNNITFETNSDDLNSDSYEELDKVVNLLSINPEIKVEISAHTDDIGSDSYNLLLSNRRAKSVVNYMIKNKIGVDRLVYKGYGEKNPLVPNTSKENRAKNRRVELKIIEIN